METLDVNIIKSSSDKVKFSLEKLRKSLEHTGASNIVVTKILETVKDELYHGITTNEIYNRAFSLLKKNRSYFASKYKLKKAIYELGPSGFPFERFVGLILKYSGYNIKIDTILQGHCRNNFV